MGVKFNPLSGQFDFTGSGSVDLSGYVPYTGATANINLGSTYKIINMIDPSSAQDGATKNYVDLKVSDTAYDATSWNGVTTIAPSKNAVRDQIEAMLTSGSGWSLTGNSGLTAGTNFVGTTDTVSLLLKTNATTRISVGSGGSIEGTTGAVIANVSSIASSFNDSGSGYTDSTNTLQYRIWAKGTDYFSDTFASRTDCGFSDLQPTSLFGYADVTGSAYSSGTFTYKFYAYFGAMAEFGPVSSTLNYTLDFTATDPATSYISYGIGNYVASGQTETITVTPMYSSQTESGTLVALSVTADNSSSNFTVQWAWTSPTEAPSDYLVQRSSDSSWQIVAGTTLMDDGTTGWNAAGGDPGRRRRRRTTSRATQRPQTAPGPSRSTRSRRCSRAPGTPASRP